MATVRQALDPRDFVPAAVNGPQFKVVEGTNFPVASLAFDAATEETAFVRLRAANYGSGNLTLKLSWYADTASSGDVIFGAAIAAITPNTDSQDVETKAFATAQTVTDSHLGTTGQRLHECEITISNLDSIAANDDFWLKIYRDADAGGDTMSGDALLVGAELSYSDA
jgi:hypothetical protein